MHFQVGFTHEPPVAVLGHAFMSLDASMDNLVLIELTLKTKFLSAGFTKCTFYLFDVHRDVVEMSMVHRIFCYSQYTTTVGVPVGGGHLTHEHSFHVCHNSGTCKTLSCDGILAACTW